MVIITLKPLREFIAAYPDSAPSLKQWIASVTEANWGTLNELKAVYPAASLVGNDRVVFNISGNKYRLIVRIVFPVRTVFIRFIGTHRDYDRVDAAAV